MDEPKILIIDDNPGICQTLEYILTEKEYLPSSVNSGKKAIKAVADKFFNLVLIDLNLPDMPGIDVLKKIKELSPDTEAIIITGHASLDTAVQAMHDAAFSYVTKPIEMDYLLTIITRALERQKLQIDRKRAEEELEQYRRHLEKLVEGRTAELRRANAELARASRHKDEFLANMSHELRTPLNVILGYAQILKSDKNLIERQREGLDTIKSSGDHLLTMINEILDLSKIEAGSMELQETEFHLPEFLKYIAETTRMRAEQKELSFVYEPDPNLPAGVRTDKKCLREVLLNLLGNAIKFTEKGWVTLRVGYRDRETGRWGDGEMGGTSLHHPTTPSPYLFFQVEDTGIGIASEQLGEIFLPFRQVSEHRNLVEGTGLGLAISHRLVGMMGGELQVKSTVSKGSIFWFELQLPEVPGVTPKEQSYGRRITGYKGEQLTVLVADDDRHNRAVLLGMLLPLGFKVVEAANGQECVEKAFRYNPDLILLDLRMPVLDGFGATQQIRQAESSKSKI